MHHAPFRLLRTSTLGAAVLGLAAGAHLIAGGALPNALILTTILALHIMVTTFVTKFRLSPPTLMAMLATSQVVLHQAFTALSPGGPAAAGLPAVGHAAGHTASHTDAYMASALAQVAPLSAHAGEATSHAAMSGTMLAAHVAASLLTAALLAYGENALWALADWLRPLCRSAAVVRVLPPQDPGTALTPRPLPRLPWRNAPPDTRRGPPQQSAFLM